jgi:hypothetical protein
MVDQESITEVIECESADEFLTKLQTPPASTRPHRPLLFRGHASDAWLLRPSSLRPYELQKVFMPESTLPADPVSQREQFEGELRILSDFLAAADSIGLPIPEDSMAFREELSKLKQRLLAGADQSDRVIWPPRHIHALLALVRHSGLPTRLLDWTSDAAKAAYFAAAKAMELLSNGASEIDGSKLLSVWAVDASRSYPLIHTARNIGSRLDEQATVPVEFFSVPRASNPNARAQRGWFSVVRLEHELDAPVRREPLDVDVACVLEKQLTRPLFQKCTLPLSEAAPLIRLLANHNIDASSVFPDYAGVAMAVRERRFYDRNV